MYSMQDELQTEEARALLRAPLEALEAMGLGRPSHLTMEKYLHLLASGALLSEPVVDAYLAVFQEMQYGQKDLTEVDLSSPTAALAEEVAALSHADEADLEWASLQLNPPQINDPAPPPQIPADTTAKEEGVQDLAQQIPRLITTGKVHGALVGSAPMAAGGTQQLPSPKLLGLGLFLLVVWSAVMLALGYRNADRIQSTVGWVQRRGQPATPKPATPRQKVEQLRASAGRAPTDKMKWMRYAMVAQGVNEYADAMHAYRYVISRWPKEAMAINNLAWLYLTAQAPYARDAKEGLLLAEQAYALDQAPYITDTLAEACFQNGMVERAVKLEEDALAREKKRKGIFRRSLKRYRQALQSTPEAP
jgi:cytochrome c-type biogenesis protein CcmH/NrfG